MASHEIKVPAFNIERELDAFEAVTYQWEQDMDLEVIFEPEYTYPQCACPEPDPCFCPPEVTLRDRCRKPGC